MSDAAAKKAETASARKREQKNRRDTETKVKRILSERCADVPKIKLDTTLHNGIKLEARLLNKFSVLKPKVRVSDKQLDEILKEYGFTAAIQGLEVENAAERVSATLTRAVSVATDPDNHIRDTSQLLTYLETTTTMNKRE